MTEPTVVKAATAADLLRHVPDLTGVAVEDSLVLVLFAGKRSAGALRVDLPRSTDRIALKRFASSVVGLACRAEGVSGVVPVAYTPETFAPAGRPPAAEVLRAVARRARQAGLEVGNLLCVAADGWGSLEDDALPRGGRPLAEIAPLHAPRRVAAAAAVVPADEAAQDAFVEDLAAWWERPEGPGGVLHGVDLRRPGAAFGRAGRGEPAMERYRFGKDTAQLVELVERSLDPHDAGRPCPCRALLFAVASRPGLPNILLVQLAAGRDAGLRVWTAAGAGDPASPALDLLLHVLQGEHVRPDKDRLLRAIEVLEETEGLAPAGLRASVTAMLAWLHWACGAGSVAGRLVDRALAEDPRHEFALIVRALVDGGHLPAWAFREDPTAPDPFAVPAA